MQSLEQLRKSIAARIRDLRTGRHWTQAKLAAALELSQSRLSELERGAGSFSAEQLVKVMMLFNVTIEHFAGSSSPDSQVQNALARRGATHLRRVAIAPDPRFEDLGELLVAALRSGDSRQIAALAPVLAKNSADLVQCISQHAESKVWWLLENVRQALEIERQRLVDGGDEKLRKDYAEAAGALDVLFDVLAPHRGEGETLLDHNIRSIKTLETVRRERSPISEKWQVITRIQPTDFVDALRASND